VKNSRSATWAITCYFDPLGEGKRLPGYKEFRRRLGISLMTVELSYDGAFALGPDDADHLIQLRAGSVLWQKERLLNVAFHALPDECDTVVWLDCDLVFLRGGWALEARRQLDEFALVQPFSRLHYLEQNDPLTLPEPGSRLLHDSFAARYVSGTVPEECFVSIGSSRDYRYAPGGAWVARRKTLDRHGFYDAAVVGGGDALILAAACSRHQDKANALRMGGAYRSHYFTWAERFSAEIQGRISFVEGDMLHLWHGELEARQYRTRYRGFPGYNFDPERDLAKASGGAWRWNSRKPELHQHVRSYFEALRSSAEPPAEKGAPD
jgi:hypothetical protein